ncbi:MAG: nuclear transport factor 2 family protein [Pseudomonadota bacterium]
MTDAHDPATVVRNVYAAFARGDIPGFFALLHPEVVWDEAKGHPYGGTYVGIDAIVKNVLTPLGAEWTDFTAEPDDFLARGDTVISLGTYRGVCRATGRRVDAPYAVVWKVEGGRVRSLHQITDTHLFHAAMR